MANNKKVIHIWLELKDNKYKPFDYVGYYDEDFSEQGSISKTFEKSLIGSYWKYWQKTAVERAKSYAKPADCSSFFTLYDPDIHIDNPRGKLKDFPTIIYLGKIEFEIPSSPKPEIKKQTPKNDKEETIMFHGEKIKKHTPGIRSFGAGISSLEELTIFPNLDNILINHQENPVKIKKITHTEFFPNLEWLYLTNTDILKLENLDPLKNLTQLCITYSKIKKIENLEKLVNLEELSLGFNKIKKIENLDKLKKLNTLTLCFTEITAINGLNNLKNLNKLGLSGNPIKKIENINHLHNLSDLRLIECRLTNIENLNGLKNLAWLDLNENQIEKLENLDNLPELWHLDVSQNKITRLENLEVLKNLRALYIAGNPINEISRATYEALRKNNVGGIGLKQYEDLCITEFIEKYDIKIVD